MFVDADLKGFDKVGTVGTGGTVGTVGTGALRA